MKQNKLLHCSQELLKSKRKLRLISDRGSSLIFGTHKKSYQIRLYTSKKSIEWRERHLSRKKLHSPTLSKVRRYFVEKEDIPDFEEFVVKTCLKDLTLLEKVEEARKPLYLKRYE